MLLNIVTDEQLLTSQIVKTVLLCLIAVGIIFNIIRIFRLQENVRRVINSCILVILCIAAYFTLKQYIIESSLLKHPEYIQGNTIGYCSVTGLGQGIEFEYEVDGQVFHNCNTYYPISKDSIKVPDGKYMVRYSAKCISEGRMDFKMPVK